MGVDLIKTQFVGGVESFQKTVESTFVPIVVLGGSKVKDDSAVLQMVYDSIQAGGKGVAMGRNIWGHKNPTKMTQAIVAIVHDDATVADAEKLLK